MVNVQAIYDVLSGKSKRLRRLYKYEDLQEGFAWIRNNIDPEYFTEAGIPIDSDIRENNLSHRFRHGFAMFHARYSERSVDALVLQKMMRHKSISSTMVYYNPTPEDELKIKTEFQEELYNMIPELRSSMKEAFDTDDNE